MSYTPLPSSTTRRHDVDLISIVSVEVCHNVAGVNSINVEVVVVIIVVVDVVVDVEDQSEDASSKSSKVNSLGSADDGGAGSTGAGSHCVSLENVWKISPHQSLIFFSSILCFEPLRCLV